MNAQVAAPEQTVTHGLRPALIGLLKSVLIAALAMLWFMAVWMLVRRLTGQLQRPLGFLPLVTVAAVLASSSTLLRLGWRTVAPNQLGLSHVAAFVAPLPAMMMLGLAICMTGTSPTALFLFWGMLFVAEVLWWYRAWQRHWIGPVTNRRPTAEATATESAAARRNQNDTTTLLAPHAELADIEDGMWMAEGMTQQFTRIDAPDGMQTIEGILRSQFEPGERSRSLHVAFCPPLQAIPDTTVTQLSGPRCRIKAADVQTYGARFDVRLAASSSSMEEVSIHFEALAAVKS